MKYAAAAILATLGLAWLAASATPDTVTVLGFPLQFGCGMRTLFGIPCPGCGMTRSVLMTLHGQFGAALEANPVGPVFLGGVLLFAATLATGRFWRTTGAYAAVTAALLLVNWVVVLSR